MGKLNFKSLKGKMNALKKFYSGHCRKCFFWRPSQEREGAPAFTESEEEGTNPDRSSKAQRHVLGRNRGGQSSLLLVSRIQRGGGISSLVILSELK